MFWRKMKKDLKERKKTKKKFVIFVFGIILVACIVVKMFFVGTYEECQYHVKIRDVNEIYKETMETYNRTDKEKNNIINNKEDNLDTGENDIIEDDICNVELEELMNSMYKIMETENYEQLYEKVKKFTILDTPSMLDVSFYHDNKVSKALSSGLIALKAWGYWRSVDYENGYYVYYGPIKDSQPDGLGTMFRCCGLDSDLNGSKEYMVMYGRWKEGKPEGEFRVYHSDYTGNGEYAVTYVGNVKDRLWDGDITMMWENLSTGDSDLAVIHATNGIFPVIRYEGTRCVYAESNSGFYWSCDKAEYLVKRGIYTW